MGLLNDIYNNRRLLKVGDVCYHIFGEKFYRVEILAIYKHKVTDGAKRHHFSFYTEDKKKVDKVSYKKESVWQKGKYCYIVKFRFATSINESIDWDIIPFFIKEIPNGIA